MAETVSYSVGDHIQMICWEDDSRHSFVMSDAVLGRIDPDTNTLTLAGSAGESVMVHVDDIIDCR